LAGEYILTDSCTAVFKNTDTLLLWHHFPDTANINFTFPNGSAVYGYGFNNTIPTVHGIEYQVGVDSCHDVMWAMMPVNGSDVTISNSTIRAIGNWFQHDDTANVSNLYDNSHYTNFVAPLSDRNQHLINTDVQTWSLYVFDKSHIDVDSCQVGEVGTEQRATVMQSTPFLLDGSGGYYWATDTSAVFSFGATDYSYARSEKNGVFVFAYGWTPFSAPQAIGQSVMIDVQSTSASDPVALEAATAWFTKIDGPDTAYTNSIIPVMGNTWIDWGPAGTGWMDYKNYSLYFQPQGFPAWGTLVKDSAVELHHANLGNWDAYGLPAGNYILKLKTKNMLGDSVEAMRPIYLRTGVGITQYGSMRNFVSVYPNPSNGELNVKLSDHESATLEIYNVVGEKVFSNTLNAELNRVNIFFLSNGIYQIRIVKSGTLIYNGRVVKE
ncbi:MAG: T9SS type A sorting domain-containing protein, partial [Bacteroidia bacterium]